MTVTFLSDCHLVNRCLPIVWRLWKAGRKKGILFLADRNVLRNVLIDQAKDRTYNPMGEAMVKIKRRAVKSREIYFVLYQALANPTGILCPGAADLPDGDAEATG